MMAEQEQIYTLIFILSFVFVTISTDQGCDKSKCKGPLKYCESIRCTPIYGTEGSCCPVRYNCDHLKGRSRNKCYYEGHVYEVDQSLREEDAGPCDIGCYCSKPSDYGATFVCAEVDCFDDPKPGCYLKESHTECCPGDEVCPQNNTKIARCEVDGKTYFDGQPFTPSSDPNKHCICGSGYTGNNVPPFCEPVGSVISICSTELLHADNIHANCAPVYYSSQNPAIDCEGAARCQNDKDRVIVAPEAATKSFEGVTISDPGSVCMFGRLTMKIGDELNQQTDYSSVCVKCVCEVPPIPTCKRLPDSKCDATIHPKFDDFAI